MSGEVFLMGNSSVTKAAGVIRVSYPANSTLVVKGTSSGKQFAKDTNTTSSAKAYIFLAPIGDASYTLTATNTAGKTVSKQVYVAKDQVKSVTLAYFSATINVTYPAKSKCIIKNSSGTQVASDTNTGTSAKTWAATVDATGTYTITATATDGSGKTKSTTASITTDGQSASVTLMYELILFDGGDNTSVTGGWKGQGVTPTVSNVLSFSITNTNETFPKAASVHTKNKIDLSKYNKLTVIKSKADGWYIGVTENEFSWSTYPPSVDSIGFAAYTGLSGNDTRIELDISGINTECYVATYIVAGSKNPELDAETYSATLTNITLS